MWDPPVTRPDQQPAVARDGQCGRDGRDACHREALSPFQHPVARVFEALGAAVPAPGDYRWGDVVPAARRRLVEGN